MAGEKENKNLSEKHQTIDTPLYLADSILVLEKELQDTKQDDIYKLQVIKNQINELKKIQQDYLELEQNGITKQTKGELQKLFLKLSIHNTKPSLIGEQIHTIQDTIKNEKNQRKDSIDMLGNMTVRDYLEKYVKFGSYKNFLRSIKGIIETEFITMFYDIFTVKYIDGGFIKDKENLNEKKWLELDPTQLNNLVEKVIEEIMQKGLDITENIIITVIRNGEKVSINLLEIINKKKYTIYLSKLNELESIVGSIDSNNILDNAVLYNKKLSKLDIYVGKFLKKGDNEGFYEQYSLILKNLKYGIDTKIVSELNGYLSSILQDIEKGVFREDKISDLSNKFKELKKQGFELKGFNLESSLVDIERKKIEIEIVILGKNIQTINGENIKEKTTSILYEIDLLTKKIRDGDSIIIREIITGNRLEAKIIDLKEKFVRKLYKVYLNKVGKKEIAGRQTINKETNFLNLLREAVVNGEINSSLMQDILSLVYKEAFTKEFNTIDGKKAIQRMNKYDKEWKKIFEHELGSIIGVDQARYIFLLTFVESNASKDKKSEAGAIGRFQVLPEVAKTNKYITEYMIVSKKKDLFNEWYNNQIIVRKSGKSKNKIPTQKEIENKKMVIKQMTVDDLVIDILKDPILSSQVAAKHLRHLFMVIKKNNPDLDNDDLILKALIMYNGDWTNRLKRLTLDTGINEIEKQIINGSNIEINTENNDSLKPQKIKEIIDKIALLLINRKNRINNNKEMTVDKAIKEILMVHNMFFNNDNIKDGVYNFKILDEYFIEKKVLTKEYVVGWIDKYIRTILDQQYLYPKQFTSLIELYKTMKEK